MLAEGALVGLPTETGYVLAAGALKSEAVQTLAGLDRVAAPCSLVLGVKSAEEVRDYVPNISRFGRKLTRRCWPGPVTFVFGVSEDAGLLKALSPTVRSAVVADRRCGFRVPAEIVIREILQLMPAPLVLATEYNASGSASGSAIATEALQIAELFGNAVSAVIDNGPSRYSERATIVEVDDDHWSRLWPGVVNDTMLRRLTGEVFLFVCTGNTCRSPLAEGLFRKLLAERFGCSEDELIDRGFVAASAGLAAADGNPASPESISVAAERGIDLSGHVSQGVTDTLLDQADRVFAMTAGHRDSLLALRPDLAEKVELLARDGSDLPDPIGMGVEEYRACQRSIEQHVRRLVEGIEVEPSA